MQTFEIVFEDGEVQKIVADAWVREEDKVRFFRPNDQGEEFPAKKLIMINEVEEGDAALSDA